MLSSHLIYSIHNVKSENIYAGEGKAPQSLNIGVFNVHGCNTNEVKKGEIGKLVFEAHVRCVCSKRD